MDASLFDVLAKHLSLPGTRRDLLGVLAALPIAGGLLEILDPAETDARGRRKRRVKRHKHGSGRRRKRKNTKSCRPEAVSQTCAGRCGNVANTCRQTVDCGPCPCTGLQPADDLQAASDGATLTLCAGTWVIPATLDISKPLTLVGAGAGQTILDGNKERRVLQITANVPVTVQGVTITRGAAERGGGGIYNHGDLTLIDVDVFDNHMTELHFDAGGGGVISDNALTLRNTLIRKNTCEGSGGGIRIDAGSLTLERGASIEENHSRSYGGGIYAEKATITMQEGSRLFKNTGNSGAGAFVSRSALTLQSGSRIEANETFNTGGGVYLTNTGTVTLERGSRVTWNKSTLKGGGIAVILGTVKVKGGSWVAHNTSLDAVGGLESIGNLAFIEIEADAVICGNSDPQCHNSWPGTITGPGACPSSATCPDD